MRNPDNGQLLFIIKLDKIDKIRIKTKKEKNKSYDDSVKLKRTEMNPSRLG